MIKRICKNISVIIVGVILITMAFRVGRCSRSVDRGKPETVYITDTLDYEIPDYVDKPGLFFRLTHESIPPRSVQPVAYKPWMDSVYCAYSIKISNGEMEIKGKRGQVSHEYIYDDVPANVEIYGTEIGFNIIKHRFKNPFGWNGVLIGSEFYGLFNEINPYVETGIRVWCININMGINKESIKEKIPFYYDINYRIW